MIALCVGHSRPNDGGAVSTAGISEHAWNTNVALSVSQILTSRNISNKVVSSYIGASYGSAMQWLGGYLSSLKAGLAVELHFNCSDNSAASGHEWLHWFDSFQGRTMAKFLKLRMEAAFPALPSRGLKGLHMRDNGAGFVRSTPCPAVICEPFFGSNERDWRLVGMDSMRYARVLADAIGDWKGAMA